MPNANSLSCSLFHWRLDNPIIISSGPLGADGKKIARLLDLGAAAVVTKTITPYEDKTSGGWMECSNAFFNREGYSKHSLSRWERDLTALRGRKVMANIFARTPDELAALARRVVSWGVEAIELGLSCPNEEMDPITSRPERLREFCMAARRAVDVPISMKVLIHTATWLNRQLLDVARDTGMNAISLSDTLPAVMLNLREGQIMLGGIGGLSGPAIKPLVQKSLIDMRDDRVALMGIGGISSGLDVLEYVGLGASAVQVCTHLISKGYKALPGLIEDTATSLAPIGGTIEELRGRLLP